MKKQLHILQGLFILTFILIMSLLIIKFIYNINQENIDTSYMWNIKLDNIKIKEGSKNCKTTIENNILKTEVLLEKEEEFYEFTFDVINNGSLDAKISEIKLGIDNPQNILTYKLSYLDGTSINKEDILESKSKKTILIRVDYPKQKDKVYEALKLSLTLNIKYTAIY